MSVLESLQAAPKRVITEAMGMNLQWTPLEGRDSMNVEHLSKTEDSKQSHPKRVTV
jgi:hypothetical protein